MTSHIISSQHSNTLVPNYHDNHTNQHDTTFATGIGPVTDGVVNTVLEKFSSRDFKEMVSDRIVSPVTEMISNKLRPYIYMCGALYLLLVILLIVIIYLLINKKGCRF